MSFLYLALPKKPCSPIRWHELLQSEWGREILLHVGKKAGFPFFMGCSNAGLHATLFNCAISKRFTGHLAVGCGSCSSRMCGSFQWVHRPASSWSHGSLAMRPFGRCTRNAEHFLHEHGLKTAPSVINSIVLRRKSSSSGDRAAASNLTPKGWPWWTSGKWKQLGHIRRRFRLEQTREVPNTGVTVSVHRAPSSATSAEIRLPNQTQGDDAQMNSGMFSNHGA